jgi:O-acetyl-ADP-ribose deacetylase (regulator of RNase III)
VSEIQYVVGDATHPVGDGVKFLCHVCNDMGAWGAGFVLAVSSRWGTPEKSYRLWAKSKFSPDSTFRLGAIELVQVEPMVFVANMIAQTLGWSSLQGPPIRYEALSECLHKLAQNAKIYNASVHMPRIGAGLAGGSWSKIEEIIKESLVDEGVSVTVYDLPS